MGASVQLREQFHAKQAELAEVFTLAADGSKHDFSRTEVLQKLGAKDSHDAVAKVKARNVELDDLSQQLQTAELTEIKSSIGERDEMVRQPARGGIIHSQPQDRDDEPKTLGDLFVESKGYKDIYVAGKQRNIPIVVDIGLKTLMTTSAGYPPFSQRSGVLVEKIDFSLSEILSVIPVFPIDQPSFIYTEETTRTHSAAETAEGAAYPESAFVFTDQTSVVRKVGDSIPVTDEQLEDVNNVRSLLDSRLRYGIRKRLASQILVGNGTPPNLRGVLAVVGIQTQAKGADSVMAAAYKALTKVRVTGDAEPNRFIFHPNDWSEVVLAQEAGGGFLWGHPAFGPMTQLWGLPVTLSTGITEGTALVGDFQNFSRLDEKRGVEVMAGYVGTQFTEGKQTLRADLRTAFTVTRPAAFCSITGV